jgi:putative adhesin
MKTIKLTSLLLLAGTLGAFAATEQINKHFAVQAGGKLVVDVDFGSIEITTHATSEVVVDVLREVTRGDKADEEAFLAERPVSFSQDGNTITIHSRASHRESRSSHGSQRTKAKYTITVPAQFNAQLKTSGGGIAVSGLTGEVIASTSGGPLEFARLHGPLDGRTSGGSIRIGDCEGAMDVKTSGGGITMENVAGKIKGSTSGGAISAKFSSPLSEEVTLESSGGAVTLRVPENSRFDLDAATSGGNVSSDLPVNVAGKVARNHFKGPVNGGGKAVVLRTSGGNIRLRKS